MGLFEAAPLIGVVDQARRGRRCQIAISSASRTSSVHRWLAIDQRTMMRYWKPTSPGSPAAAAEGDVFLSPPPAAFSAAPAEGGGGAAVAAQKQMPGLPTNADEPGLASTTT